MRFLIFATLFLLAGCADVQQEAPIVASDAPPAEQTQTEPQQANDPTTQEPEPSPEPSPEPAPEPSTEPAPEPSADPSPTANVTTQEPVWGSPSGKGLRPGINMVYGGAGCTTSFVFHVNWTDYYMATAAHCVSDGGGCDGDATVPGGTADLRLNTGGSVKATVAYHAWATMARVHEADANTCDGNDFALLKIPETAMHHIHPASLHFEAPTGLATKATTDIWGYGASSLKFGVSDAHPKQGRHLGTAEGGWSHFVYLGTPGIPGDSGGHIMTKDGQALGIASRIILSPYPGANYYTDIAKSLAYMEVHEGWAPELVTWDNFNASLL